MKNIANPIYTASALLASMMTFAACDEVAQEDRLIYVEPTAVSRAVLIEDFTGQRCVNCPKATVTIHEIQELYGEENVVAVAIHCGSFGFAGNKNTVGLMTDLGKEYWNKWFPAGSGQPVAKINRGPATEDYGGWGADVAKALAQPSKVNLSCTVSYDADSRMATITTNGMAPAGYQANLQLWLLEDGIIALQSMPDGQPVNMTYEHNHVLRDAINGTWGEEVTMGENTASWNHTYTLPENYVAENCSVVAFIYDNDGVQQVVKTPIVK